MSPAAPPSVRWSFAVEIFPADWRFPPGPAWIAGWILDAAGSAPSDLRAWIDGRPVLGLPGLPRPEIEARERGRAGPPYAGFSFLLQPHRGATQLRLDARDATGRWTEFFRTAISVDPAAPAAPAPRPLAADLPAALLALLKCAREHRTEPLADIAAEVLAARRAEPLESLPNPPFHGALEQPLATGRLRYGRLEVTGWLAHRTAAIRRLTALIEPADEVPLLHGLPREGVAAVFGDLPGAERSQFLGHADLSAAVDWPPLLRVFAELDDGSKHLVFARRFAPRVIAGAERGLGPGWRREFTRALWALRSAAARLGLPAGAPGELLAAARAAWAAYAAEAPAPAGVRRPAPVPLPPPSAAPCRVLVVTHNFNFEGAPWFICELARHLAAQPGLHVRVAAPADGPMRRVWEEAGLPVQIVDVAPALAASDAGEFSTRLDSAAAALRLDETDVVVANTMVSFWAVELARAAGKPALMYVHESTPVRRFFEPLVAPALFPAVEAAFRRATRVVFTADSTRRVHAHLEAGNFVALPSWVDVGRIDAFAAAHDPRALRRKHGLDPDATLVVNIGSLCERKGQHVFLRAIELLRDELRAVPAGRRVEWVMVGARPGPYLEALKLEARLHGLDGVRFIPETGEIHDFYRLADIFCCTSFEESFPRVLLESAAYRLLIVSTDVNGIAEMLGRDDGWFVPPGDRTQLAAALRAALAAHFSGDRSRGEKARAAVLARYHEAKSLPQHAALVRAAAAAR